MLYYYHFSDFLEEKVILSSKGMNFFSALLSPEWCLLFWEEVLLLHWYIIAANSNHCLRIVSRHKFEPHTLSPWYLRKNNPIISLWKELTLLQRKMIIRPRQRTGCEWGFTFSNSLVLINMRENVRQLLCESADCLVFFFLSCCTSVWCWQMHLSPWCRYSMPNIWIWWQTVKWDALSTGLSITPLTLFSVYG